MATAHRDNPRTRYENQLDALEAVVGGAPEDTDGPGQLRGDVSKRDAEAIRDLLDALDPDRPGKVFNTPGNGRKTLANKSLGNYAVRLRLAATEADGDLLDQDTDSINDLMGDMKTGDADVSPSGGYASGTVGQYQSALKSFYQFHDGHGVDPDDIPVFASDQTTVDERDMFTVDEVQAMRDAIESPRERCLFELLCFTGQRIRAIQTLRIKDIDLDDEVLYLNEGEDGLKDAKGKRPLLGAEAYVRGCINYHPTGEPDDYLITPAATGGGEPGGMLTQDTIRYHLEKIADKAGVDKDVHPHIFRHYFTTIAKRDYDMDDAYIKHLRGDAPGSNVMETTYRHLSDDDAVDHAKEKTGDKEPEEDDGDGSPLTPDKCDVCGALLDGDDKACSACGTVYALDARHADKKISETVDEDKDDAEDLETYKLLDELERIKNRLKAENPEVLEEA